MIKIILDLDNTLLKIDSDYEWNLFITKLKTKNKFFFLKNSIFIENYSKSTLNKLNYFRFTLKIFNKINFCNYINIKDIFYKKLLKTKLIINYINKIHNNKLLKNFNIINTSTNILVSKIINKHIKINHIINSYNYKIKYKLNIIYNNYNKGIINYKINKIINSEIYFNNKNKVLIKNNQFHTDSKNDIFLLKITNLKQIINPDKILFNFSISNYWKIFIFKLFF